jgi:hypothetical protein
MSQIIEDRHDQQLVGTEAMVPQPPTGHRRRGRLRHRHLAVAGVLLASLTALVAIRMATSSSPASARGFTNGSSVEVVLRCTSAACVTGISDPVGSQWSWITTSGTAIPDAWSKRDTTGSIEIDGEWGNATFRSGGQSMVLTGGRATPEHTFFG